MKNYKTIGFSFFLCMVLTSSINCEKIRVFFSEINKPQHLYCVKINRKVVPKEEQLLVVTLQGVISKKQPSIFIIEDDPEVEKDAAEYWLEEMSKKNITWEYVNSVWDLLSKFKNSLDGYILCKINTETVNVATSLCSIYNAIAVDESIKAKVEEYGLKMILDVRDKTQEWCFNNYKDKFNNRCAATIVYSSEQHDSYPLFLRDYIIATGMFCFYDETRNLQKIVYPWLEIDSPVFGWDPGTDENVQIEELSEQGLFRIPSDWSLNMSVYAGLEYPIEEIRYSKDVKLKNIFIQRNKHFVVFLMTDGDNISWFQGNSFLPDKRFWQSPYRGKFPLGFTIPSSSLELSPQILAYINSTRKENESFVPALSGNGYFYADIYGRKRNKDALKIHCKKLNEIFKVGNWKILQVMSLYKSINATDFTPYAQNIDNLLGLFWVYYSPYSAGAGEIRWVKNKEGILLPVVSTRFSLWKMEPSSPDFLSAEEIIQQIRFMGKPPKKNYFTVISVHCWSWEEPLKEANKIYEELSKEEYIRFVTPEEFMTMLILSHKPKELFKMYLSKFLKQIKELKNIPEYERTVLHEKLIKVNELIESNNSKPNEILRLLQEIETEIENYENKK